MESQSRRLAYHQYPIILDRLKRQNLLLESFAEHLGFKAIWDNGEVVWMRIKGGRKVRSKTRTSKSHESAIRRHASSPG